MRVLTFTSLYPNKIEPRHGIFVKNRMDYFDIIEGTSRNVMAPVQYFPLLGLNKKSKFHTLNQIPLYQRDGNISVYHPRYLTIPGTNVINVAAAMAAAADKILPKIYKNSDFDLIDGHYLYPDGVAAYHLAKKYHKPLFLTARGSDVNFWMTQKKSRRAVLEALNYASKIICVSQALKQKLMGYGVAKDKLITVMNGVDRTIFKADIRAKNSNGYLLSVGNLIPLKGHDYILRSLVDFPKEKLIIIGSGPCEKDLKDLAHQLNIADRVSFFNHIPQHDLPAYYAGAKYTILMSSMEGMPNVVLESLAMGTPVIATDVGGIAEVITKDNGILLPQRNHTVLTHALRLAEDRLWDNQQISKDTKFLDWHETAKELYKCFSSVG